jgi:hypothetical protein
MILYDIDTSTSMSRRVPKKKDLTNLAISKNTTKAALVKTCKLIELRFGTTLPSYSLSSLLNTNKLHTFAVWFGMHSLQPFQQLQNFQERIIAQRTSLL